MTLMVGGHCRGAVWLVAAVTFLHSCGEEQRFGWAERLASIEVTLSGGDLGTPDSPLDPAKIYRYTLDIAVRSAGGGSHLNTWEGWVRVSARPGRVSLGKSPTTQPGVSVVGQDVFVQGGEARGISLTLENAFGPTVVWVEDVGFTPPTAGRQAACSNGHDDDGDGRLDCPWDAGCLDASDDSEEGGSYASGLSQTLWFQNPTLATIQGRGGADPSVSPYVGEAVTIDSGFLVVTRITRDGMTVTDRADWGGFNHIFVYTFNTPAGVRVCDRLVSLSGIVVEYYGFTEITFPTWVLDPWSPDKGPCPIPEPRVLGVADLRNKTAMEGLESALIRVENVRVGDRVVNCDLDGNGRVDWRDYKTNVCSEECRCREECEKDALCTEESQYRAYGQWVVAVGGETGQKLLIVSRDAAPDYEPFGPGHPTQIRALTGTLRNMSFLRPPWILEPRCPDDIVFIGEPRPIGETCISPRTGEEEEPR